MSDDLYQITADGIGVRQLARLSFAEDAPYGDISASLTVPARHRSRAVVVAREQLIFCGAEFVPVLIEEFRSDLRCEIKAKDGARMSDGETMLELEGTTRAILQFERPLLNFLQRLAGVASLTAETVATAGGITILDTRKTMPGWRVLDKYAVRVGGGKNHRFSLSDMIMVKNNHVDANGGDMARTLSRIVAGKPHYAPFQVEVRSVEELKSAVAFNPDAIMLDNMSDAMIEQCLGILKATPQIMVEVSGGLTAARLASLSKLGVPAVSMGALTTSARNRDISLRIIKASGAT